MKTNYNKTYYSFWIKRTFFDRISILVKYNGWVFLENWRKITRFSWENTLIITSIMKIIE